MQQHQQHSRLIKEEKQEQESNLIESMDQEPHSPSNGIPIGEYFYFILY